jgi:hypothetical protein
VKKLLAAIALASFGIGCSSPCTPGGCSQGYVCVEGNFCAERCDENGGATCPIGTTCQRRQAACTGTACTAAVAMVCL